MRWPRPSAGLWYAATKARFRCGAREKKRTPNGLAPAMRPQFQTPRSRPSLARSRRVDRCSRSATTRMPLPSCRASECGLKNTGGVTHSVAKSSWPDERSVRRIFTTRLFAPPSPSAVYTAPEVLTPMIVSATPSNCSGVVPLPARPGVPAISRRAPSRSNAESVCAKKSSTHTRPCRSTCSPCEPHVAPGPCATAWRPQLRL
eukprot:3056027-Prymnesium_polylepis.2